MVCDLEPVRQRLRRGCSFLKGIVLTLFWVGICPVWAWAQAKPIVTITPKTDTPRSQAPLLFDAKVTWNFPTVLEGTLQLEFFAAQRKLHTWVSRELALSNSEITLPVMAPAVIVNESNESLDIRVTFISEQQTYTYDDELNMLVWPDWKRVMVVGVIHPELSQISRSGFIGEQGEDLNSEAEWVSKYRLDDLLPDRRLSNHFVTRSIRVDPGDLPVYPLELVTYDMLVLTREGLHQLNKAQLNAIADWTEAGGSVCVLSDHVTTAAAQGFVKRILDSDAISPKVRFDADGVPYSLLPDFQRWQLSAPGVGRGMMTIEPIPLEDDEFRQAVLALWKMRFSQRQYVADHLQWNFPKPKNQNRYSAEDYLTSLDNPLYHPMVMPPAEPEALQQTLMPDRVEGVPFSSVALLLLACLLAVGPGDYFLLGALKKRRWTWVLFPVVAVSFALYTIRLAQSHMGETDHRNSLNIVDLTRDGRPARVSRFELLFAATEKDVVTERSQEFVVPIENRPKLQPYETAAHYYAPEDPLIAMGRVPLNYSTVRAVHQWKPQLSRITRIGELHDLSLPQFEWGLITADSLTDDAARQKLFRQITDALPNATITLVHQGKSIPTAHSDADSGSTIYYARDPHPESEGAQVLSYIQQLSQREPVGAFQVVAQIAPNGSGNFEDLALLDESDPGQFLLLIHDSNGQGNHTVYRRLLRRSN